VIKATWAKKVSQETKGIKVTPVSQGRLDQRAKLDLQGRKATMDPRVIKAISVIQDPPGKKVTRETRVIQDLQA
jgi:hypothetical protein